MIEALISLLLGSLLVMLAWNGVARQRLAIVNMTERADWLSTIRMGRLVLARDLASRSGDLSASRDTVGFRVVRGVGLRCTWPGATGDSASLALRYRGIRRPDPNKDSVRVMTEVGHWEVAPLLRVTSVGSCGRPGGGIGLRLHLGRPIVGAVLAEVFEAGSYHLSNRAIRYRRAGGGRQPLSPENVGDSSTFGPDANRLTLVSAFDPEVVWVVPLRGGGDP